MFSDFLKLHNIYRWYWI